MTDSLRGTPANTKQESLLRELLETLLQHATVRGVHADMLLKCQIQDGVIQAGSVIGTLGRTWIGRGNH